MLTREPLIYGGSWPFVICLMYSSLGSQVLYVSCSAVSMIPPFHICTRRCFTVPSILTPWSLWSSIPPNMGNCINKGAHKNFSKTSSVLHPAGMVWTCWICLVRLDHEESSRCPRVFTGACLACSTRQVGFTSLRHFFWTTFRRS
jgi:hypothetical protein